MDVAKRTIRFYRRRRAGLLRSAAGSDRRVNPTELVYVLLWVTIPHANLNPHSHSLLTGVLSTSIPLPPR